MTEKQRYEVIKYDGRLFLPLDFVCEILDVAQEDFATLAISNLLDEELDHIKNGLKHHDLKHIDDHRETVKAVKFEANGWVINRK
jgi:hypothetical protein